MTKQASILIVDDIVDNLKLLNEILSANGFNVRPADNGKLAVVSAIAEKPDMILLDVRMPEMDGFEVCRRLKADYYTADIPVIFISAYDELPDRLKGFELGAVDFITKPFEPREVLARIHTQLEISRLRQELIQQADELLTANRQLYKEIEQRKQIEHQLQEKAEEIEVQNEELQSQGEELKSQNDEFQYMNEELLLTKKQIEQSEEKYHLIFDYSPLGLLSFDAGGAIVACNENFAKIIGSPVERLIGLNLLALPDQNLVLAIRQALDGNTGFYEGDYHSVTAVKITPVRITFASMGMENGQVRGGVGIVEDVSKRKKSESLLLDLVDKNPMSIQMLDNEGYTLQVNPAHTKLFGAVPPPEYCFFCDPQLYQQGFGELLTKAQNGEVVQFPDFYYNAHEVRAEFPDTPVWIRMIVFPINSSEGKPERFIVMHDNITERKNSEDANLKLQEQLNQAQKMESVGRLAGGVAHDFNNMLSVILGHANLAMLKIEDDNPLKRVFEQITAAANRSADLTRQLLAFARKQVIDPKKLDLNDAVCGMFNILKRLIGEDIDLIWRPAETTLPVKVDPTQISQLLTNLLVNARDAINGVGEIVVSTSAEKIDAEFCKYHTGFETGDFVVLTVTDNGCGMTKEVMSQIFDPFFTTKGEGKGTGLGMAMVYGIIKQNNGFIDLYSEPSVGTSFKIYLPRYQEINPELPADNPSGEMQGGSETVLVVEDELTVLEVSKAMLETLGYKVLAANSPEEAFVLAKEHAEKIDLLFTDVIMPRMNGRDLANQLHALYPDLKIIFTSGYTAENIDRHGMLEEGICFIQKPFTVQELESKIREILK